MSAVVLTTSVMSHPVRAQYAEELARRLGGAGGIDVAIVQDPDPSGPPSSMRTARRAWEGRSAAATHRLVIQDDVVIPPRFIDLVHAAIEQRPESVLSLYANWHRPTSTAARVAAAVGADWVRAEGIACPALVMPARIADDFVDYAQTPDLGTTEDDEAIKAFLREAGEDSYLLMPNLVAHRNLPSISGEGLTGRRDAVCYIGHPRDPFVPDRAKVLPRLAFLPGLSNGKAVAYRPISQGRDYWEPCDLSDALEVVGLAESNLRDLYCSMKNGIFQKIPFGERDLAASLVEELWIASYLIGLWGSLLSSNSGASIWGGKPSKEVVDRCLYTLAIGGLSPTLDREFLVRHGGDFFAVASQAFSVSAGFAPPSGGSQALVVDG